MNYTEIFTKNIDGTEQKHIVIELPGGGFKTFPALDTNPEYVAWLAEQDV